ncbi:chemotaxis protein CheY [uncultured Microbacterium sp.]|uniref:4'-phosphopantetheinyl transferase family protein n=1 Tax=uncultured Microbacterium sp. TaxID=191216 RepID=UPI0025F75C93|nr:chemotaxis protein CheY [uncultured Microbacterium sp.]
MTLPAGIRVAWRRIPPATARRETSRALLAELLPGADVVSRCPACGGAHGRIRVRDRDAAASVSYAGGWAVAAVSTGAGRGIGVDAVPRGAAGMDRILASASPDRAWARVEAVLKADGRGLTVDPRRVEVHERADGWTASIDGVGGWAGWDVDGPEGVVVAVAVGCRRVE